MAISHWIISVLNAGFAFSIFVASFLLLLRGIMEGLVTKNCQQSIKEKKLILKVFKGDLLYGSVPIVKNIASIGRDQDCDVFLKGSNIPLCAGEIYFEEENCFFKNYAGNEVIINDKRSGKEELLEIGSRIFLMNYMIELEKMK